MSFDDDFPQARRLRLVQLLDLADFGLDRLAHFGFASVGDQGNNRQGGGKRYFHDVSGWGLQDASA
jgi:hypothetical protein